jgi:hypothetical protein
MNDADPISDRRNARRERVVTACSMASLLITTLSVYLSLLFVWSAAVERVTGLDPGKIGMLRFLVSLAVGGVSALLTGEAVERVHRTLWPEHPEGHER